MSNVNEKTIACDISKGWAEPEYHKFAEIQDMSGDVRNSFAVVFPLLFFQTRLGSSSNFDSNLSFLGPFWGASGKFPFYCLEKILNNSTGNYYEKMEWIFYPFSTFHTNGPSRLRTSPFYQ